MHISDLSNTEIVIKAGAIAGAMHVTKCYGVNISCQSFHQLRIHESSDLRLSIGDAASSGGVILEECTNLTFLIESRHATPTSSDVASDETQLLEVKDFNWLRNGIPSPNFDIEIVRADRRLGNDASLMPNTGALMDFAAEKANGELEVTGDCPSPAAVNVDVAAEESDEDEL